MNVASQASMRGNVLLTVRDAETGRVIQRQRVKNLVVDTGRTLIAQLLSGSAPRPSHLAVGTSSTAVGGSDTTLISEVGRVAITTGSVSGNVLTIAAYIGSAVANGFTLREVGLLNAASGGTLFARALISSIVKSSSVTITVTWTFTITSS